MPQLGSLINLVVNTHDACRQLVGAILLELDLSFSLKEWARAGGEYTAI
jgi:hypothetical protein